MVEFVGHAVRMRYGMEIDVYVMRDIIGYLVFVVFAIRIHHMMDSIVSVIMVTMGIEINVKDASQLVANAQDQMQMNARLVLI